MRGKVGKSVTLIWGLIRRKRVKNERERERERERVGNRWMMWLPI